MNVWPCFEGLSCEQWAKYGLALRDTVMSGEQSAALLWGTLSWVARKCGLALRDTVMSGEQSVAILWGTLSWVVSKVRLCFEGHCHEWWVKCGLALRDTLTMAVFHQVFGCAFEARLFLSCEYIERSGRWWAHDKCTLLLYLVLTSERTFLVAYTWYWPMIGLSRLHISGIDQWRK